MKRNLLSIFTVSIFLLMSLVSCNTTVTDGYDNPFAIHFIDVGQGDAALIECNGHYMLIDGGPYRSNSDENNVCKYIESQNIDISHLDYLVASHLHEDHIGGLINVLDYMYGKGMSIGYVLSNSQTGNTDKFNEFENWLTKYKVSIIIPDVDHAFYLGDAKITVIDNYAKKENDSLVLLVEYGDTKFLFTGDIQRDAQARVAEKLYDILPSNLKSGRQLIKIPHHGAFNDDPALPIDSVENALNALFSAFPPDFSIISVGTGNKYNHPDHRTLKILNNKNFHSNIYRTDENGNIIVWTGILKVQSPNTQEV